MASKRTESDVAVARTAEILEGYFAKLPAEDAKAMRREMSPFRVSAKHLPVYLDEMCFRFYSRKTPYLFPETTLELISSPILEYKKPTSHKEKAD
jgi:hypothetical protein